MSDIIRRLRSVLAMVAISAFGGAIFGASRAEDPVAGILYGSISGGLAAAVLATLHLFIVKPLAGDGVRQLPFSVSVGLKTIVDLGVILAVLEFVSWVLPGDTLSTADLLWTSFFGFLFAFAISFARQIDRLLGPGELFRFVLGRYHRPREVERIFLFLDIVQSTPLAERLDDLRFLEFLNAVYGDASQIIVAFRGEIHKYVGDEMIVAWTPRRGFTHARCIDCVFAIEARLAAAAASYEARFGVVPALRYGLHAGRVASGELGRVKQEVAYVGDTVNIASRLVDVCRSHRRTIVVSADLLSRLTLPDGILAEPLGAVDLRGRQAPLTLFALARADAGSREDRLPPGCPPSGHLPSGHLPSRLGMVEEEAQHLGRGVRTVRVGEAAGGTPA